MTSPISPNGTIASANTATRTTVTLSCNQRKALSSIRVGGPLRRMSAAAMPPSDRNTPNTRNVCPTATAPKSAGASWRANTAAPKKESTRIPIPRMASVAAPLIARRRTSCPLRVSSRSSVALTSVTFVLSCEARSPRRFVLDPD